MEADRFIKLIVETLEAEDAAPSFAPHCWKFKGCKNESCPIHGEPGKICWEQNKPECADCEYRKSLSEADVLLLHLEKLCVGYMEFKRKASIYREILETSQGVFRLGQEVRKVSHEINNIVGILNGYVQLATLSPEKQDLNQIFKLVSQGCRRISDIISHLKRLRAHANLSLERPADCFKEIFESMFSEMTQRKIDWEVKDTERIWMLSKPACLQRLAFHNIKSVLEWLGDNGKISIKVRSGGNNVLIDLTARKRRRPPAAVPYQLALPFEELSEADEPAGGFDERQFARDIRAELDELKGSVKVRQGKSQVRIQLTLPVVSPSEKG